MGKMAKITELAEVIRSKNSGPFELTLDIMFKDAEIYRRVKESGVITRELIARLYNTTPEKVVSFVEFDPAKAIKATIERPLGSGAVGESDVYGAQQHAPLLNIEIPWD